VVEHECRAARGFRSESSNVHSSGAFRRSASEGIGCGFSPPNVVNAGTTPHAKKRIRAGQAPTSGWAPGGVDKVIPMMISQQAAAPPEKTPPNRKPGRADDGSAESMPGAILRPATTTAISSIDANRIQVVEVPSTSPELDQWLGNSDGRVFRSSKNVTIIVSAGRDVSTAAQTQRGVKRVADEVIILYHIVRRRLHHPQAVRVRNRDGL
jgi:hypothetical protein